jgi:hypothetical protein
MLTKPSATPGRFSTGNMDTSRRGRALNWPALCVRFKAGSSGVTLPGPAPGKAIARRHGCTVKDVHGILDEHAFEVLTPHNRAHVLSIELQRSDELHRIFHKHAV